MATPARASEDKFVEAFGAARDSLPTGGQDWVARLRAQAIETFRHTGLPQPKTEAWKFTQLKPLLKHDFEPVAPYGQRAPSVPLGELPVIAESGVTRLVLTDGQFRPELSDPVPAGVEALSLAQAFASHPDFLMRYLGQVGPLDATPLWSLNTALMLDGVVLHVPADTVVERPIQIVNYNGAEGGTVQFHRRNLVVVESGADVTLIDSHYGPDGSVYFANGVSETVVGEGARLRHYVHQSESRNAFHIANNHVRVDASATYDNFCVLDGARLCRNEMQLSLMGGDITAKINGVYMGLGNQHLDTTTHIIHAEPDAYSEESYKGALMDNAHGVFQGKISVRPDAQRTNGYQLNRVLLLSDKAEINAKPELEIYADDVACSHGCTTGELDHEALFYLRSRGLSETLARNLLVKSYLEEALDFVTHDEVREGIRGLIQNWLDASGQGTRELHADEDEA